MTEAERQLLEDTARSLLRLSEETRGRLDCIEHALHALYLANGNGQLALARLRIARDLRRGNGDETKYLDAFIGTFEGHR